MFRRVLKIVTVLVLGGGLVLTCLLGVAVYAFWCPVSVTAQRGDQIPVILAPPETRGQVPRRITLPQPPRTLNRTTLTTSLSVAEVLDFFTQQLVADGWDRNYSLNQQTNQLFIVHKQACPFYALEITVRPSSPSQTQILIDPYWPDSPECGDCN